MPIRMCVEPRCANHATGRGRCDFHRKALERDRSRARRDKQGGAYQTKRYQAAPRRRLYLNPICQRCDQRLAVEVHHAHHLEYGGDMYALEQPSELVWSVPRRAASRGRADGWRSGPVKTCNG